MPLDCRRAGVWPRPYFSFQQASTDLRCAYLHRREGWPKIGSGGSQCTQTQEPLGIRLLWCWPVDSATVGWRFLAGLVQCRLCRQDQSSAQTGNPRSAYAIALPRISTAIPPRIMGRSATAKQPAQYHDGLHGASCMGARARERHRNILSHS